MIRFYLLAGAFFYSLVGVAGATLNPERLLAADTIAILTLPHWPQAISNALKSPYGQLWSDSAMKAFREKFITDLKKDLEPFEREFGLKLSDYAGMIQGQMTLAFTRNGWDGRSDRRPAFVLMAETKDKSTELKTNLLQLRRRWTETGKQTRTERIRDVEFTTLIFSSDEIENSLKSIFPPRKNEGVAENAKKPQKPTRMEWSIGQSDSLLLLGNSLKEIEKVLILQSGGSVPTIGDQASFATSTASMREALAFGWVDVKAIVNTISMRSTPESEDKAPATTVFPNPAKVLSVLGISGIQALSFSYRQNSEGGLAQLALNIPESYRKGIFQLLSPDRKDAAPTVFVPADAVKFSRWRIDLQKAWSTLEGMLLDIYPQMAGGIKLLLDNAGKDKDPNFDLRKNLVANLGDDLISYSKNPRDLTPEQLKAPPNLTLLGSRNAEQLATSLKAVTSIFPPQMTKFKEREFLGRRIYTMTLPGQAIGASAKPGDRPLNWSASGGYVAFSKDVAMLEEYLRSGEGTAKSLRDSPGLNEAAQTLGGMATGFFSYENRRETMRAAFELLKRDSSKAPALLSSSKLGTRLGLGEENKLLKERFDFSLLPDYDKLRKYLSFDVSSGTMSSEGFTFRFFMPTLPQVKDSSY